MVKRPTPLLDKLLSRTRRCTQERGLKTALAEVLLVPPQRLHEWLSGSVEPGGETTLQLLQWVTAVEAKQKDAGQVAARPAQMTRKSKSKTNEKAKSDRPKS